MNEYMSGFCCSTTYLLRFCCAASFKPSLFATVVLNWLSRVLEHGDLIPIKNFAYCIPETYLKTNQMNLSGTKVL